MPQERDIELAKIREGLITTQAIALANQYILAETLRLLIQHSEDPQAVLQRLSESVMARLDQKEPQGQGGPMPFLIRSIVRQFMTQAGQSFDVQGPQADP